MLVRNQFDEIVVARLFDFWADHIPWERALWTNGTLGRLEELLESSKADIPPAALAALRAQVEQFIGADQGLGGPAHRALVMARVRGDLDPAGVGWHGLSQLLPTLRADYLARWAQATTVQPQPAAERVARYTAAHLLDCGYSPTHLYRWLDGRVRHDATPYSLVDLLQAADQQMAAKAPTEFAVLVPVESAPRIPQPAPATWRGPADTTARIQQWGGDTSNLRQNGSFTIDVIATDRYAAAAAALSVIDRWNARVELATSRSLRTCGRVWIEAEAEAIDVRPRRRGVDIPELIGESKLYVEPSNEAWARRIDDAFQLVQPMESGPRAAGIAGGWAGIESLLTVAGEGEHVATARMAAIVAGSFPRAELTRLAWLHETAASDALASSLAGKSNLERSELVAMHLTSGGRLSVSDDQDVASELRMLAVLAAPQAVLKRVQSYVDGTLSRLYRHRNLIMHAGLVSGDGRQSVLRSAAPLVGAGFDRIAHAWFVEKTNPIQLAARAENNIALLGTTSATVTRVLEA